MASINISEDDFMAVAMAAHAAKDAGDMDQAVALDKIARKINASLSAAGTKAYAWIGGGKRKPLGWQDMPSTLDRAHHRSAGK